MTPFSHWFPQQQVLFGQGIASDLGEPLARLNITRPLIVCSPRAEAGPHVRAIVAQLPPGAGRIWNGVQPHAPLHAALEGGEAARSHGADGIVSIGGGSASDLAKGIALAYAEGPGLESFALRRDNGAPAARPSSAPKIPIVALPSMVLRPFASRLRRLFSSSCSRHA